MQNYSDKIKFAIYSSIACILWLGLHFFPGKISMFNYWDWNEFQEHQLPAHHYIESAINYHQTFPAFARRPISNIILGSNWGISKGFQFIIAEIGAMLAFMWIWFQYKRPQFFRMFPWMLLCFPILLAWFPTNYTYEEPFQWFMLMGFVYMLQHQRWILANIFIFLSLLTRETSILFIVSWMVGNSAISWKKLIPGLMLGVLWYGLNQQGMEQEMAARWTLLFDYNFQNQDYSIETIIFWAFTVFPSIFLCKYLSKRDLIIFVVFLLLNTFLVLYGAKAREARLHMLPLLFLWLKTDETIWLKFQWKWANILGCILGAIFMSIFLFSSSWTTTGMMIESSWVREYGILWGGMVGLTLGMIIFENSTERK